MIVRGMSYEEIRKECIQDQEEIAPRAFKIIKSNKGEPYVRVLNEEEYKEELEKKLLEECNEVIHAKESNDRVEELADVMEIIFSLARLEDKSLQEIQEVMLDKRKKRGGFENRIYLEKVIEE